MAKNSGPSSVRNRPADRIYEYWWEPILAIPPLKDSTQYERLKHLWIDPTRTRVKGGTRLQEFYNSGWETHVTAVLWENFAVLPPEKWLPQLAKRARLKRLSGQIVQANWSYGWVWSRVGGRKIADIVLHYRSATGEEGVFIVEAKAPWVRLKAGKDADASYYLSIPIFQKFQRRSLIYLVDESHIEEVRRTVKVNHYDVGFLTWQELGGIQVAIARGLDLPIEIRTFVAGALQSKFLGFGIKPSILAADYLITEKSRQEVDMLAGPQRQNSVEREQRRWLLATREAAT